MNPLVNLRYEVHGKVQGVFFRKYTHKHANALGLRGWVMNTPQGTVVGEAEGPKVAIEQLKRWLKEEGSPKSRVDKTSFDEHEIPKYTYTTFDVRR